MSKSIIVAGGIITVCNMNFKCPACECPHTEDDYANQLYKSKKGFIYKKCKGCKSTIGITSDMKGDTVVWIKSEEKSIKH